MKQISSYVPQGITYLEKLDKIYSREIPIIREGCKGRDYHRLIGSGWLFAEPIYTLMDIITLEGKKINIKINHGYGYWPRTRVPVPEMDTYVFISLNDQVLELVNLKELLSFLKGEVSIKSLFKIRKDSSYKNSAGFIAEFGDLVCITEIDFYKEENQDNPYCIYNPEYDYDSRLVDISQRQFEVKRQIGSLIESIEGSVYEKFISIKNETEYKDMIYDLTEGELADMIVREGRWKPIPTEIGESDSMWVDHYFGENIFPSPIIETFGVSDNPDVAFIRGGGYCCLNHDSNYSISNGKAVEYKEYALLIKLTDGVKDTPVYFTLYGGIKKAGAKTHYYETEFLKHVIKFFKRESNKYSDSKDMTDLINLTRPNDGHPMNSAYGLLSMAISENGRVFNHILDDNSVKCIVHCHGNCYENSSDQERLGYIVNKYSFNFEDFFKKISNETISRVIFYLGNLLSQLQEEQNSTLAANFPNYYEVVDKTTPLFEYFRKFQKFPYNSIFWFSEGFKKELKETYESSIEKYIEHYSKFINSEWYYFGEHTSEKFISNDLPIKFPHGYDEVSSSTWLFLRGLDSIPVLIKINGIKKVKLVDKDDGSAEDGIQIEYQLRYPLIKGEKRGNIYFGDEAITPPLKLISSAQRGYVLRIDRYDIQQELDIK